MAIIGRLARLQFPLLVPEQRRPDREPRRPAHLLGIMPGLLLVRVS
jgi:hypothetical protein